MLLDDHSARAEVSVHNSSCKDADEESIIDTSQDPANQRMAISDPSSNVAGIHADLTVETKESGIASQLNAESSSTDGATPFASGEELPETIRPSPREGTSSVPDLVEKFDDEKTPQIPVTESGVAQVGGIPEDSVLVEMEAVSVAKCLPQNESTASSGPAAASTPVVSSVPAAPLNRSDDPANVVKPEEVMKVENTITSETIAMEVLPHQLFKSEEEASMKIVRYEPDVIKQDSEANEFKRDKVAHTTKESLSSSDSDSKDPVSRKRKSTASTEATVPANRNKRSAVVRPPNVASAGRKSSTETVKTVSQESGMSAVKAKHAERVAGRQEEAASSKVKMATAAAVSSTAKKRGREGSSASPGRSADPNGRISANEESATPVNEDTDLSEDGSPEDGQPVTSHSRRGGKKRKTVTTGGLGGTTGRHSEVSNGKGSYRESHHLSLNNLPEGWRAPLTFFVKEGAYCDEKGKEKKAWARLPLRKVSNGAAWLTESCSGTPGIMDHVDGPTEIIKDLCSCMQGSDDELKLHPKSHVSVTRATARKDFDPNKFDLQHVLALPKSVKIHTEKEFVHFLPLDLIAFQLSQQIRAIVSSSGQFPSHLFAPDMHICQYAPTVIIHLAAYHKGKTLDKLLSLFLGPENQHLFESFRNIYNKKLGTRAATSRRRRGADVGAVFTGTLDLTDNEVHDFLSACDSIDKRLDILRTNVFPNHKAPLKEFSAHKAFRQNDVIIRGVTGHIITRYAAALRDHLYQYYDIPPYLLSYDLDEDDPLFDCLARESRIWLDSALGIFLDITLSLREEEHLISFDRIQPPDSSPKTPTKNSKHNSRMKSNTSKSSMDAKNNVAEHSIEAEDDSDRATLQYLVSHTGANGNATVCIKLPGSEMKYDCLVNHTCTISVVATKDIPAGSSVILDNVVKKTTWAEIADDKDSDSQG